MRREIAHCRKRIAELVRSTQEVVSSEIYGYASDAEAQDDFFESLRVKLQKKLSELESTDAA